MEDFTGLYDIRDFKAEDTNFILASFYNGVYYGDFRFKNVPKKTFMENYRKIGEGIIADPINNIIKVACLKEDPDVILGYSILSGDYSGIKWVFVKDRWRKSGIGRSLVPKYPVYCTHMTKIGEQLATKFENLTFNPFN